MKAIQVKCPSCGAKLPVKPEAEAVTCDYCSVESLIRRRSGVFETIAASPDQPKGESRPVATQARSTRSTIIAILSGVVFLSATVGPVILISLHFAFAFQWGGMGVLLPDVDGDGIADPVGQLRFREEDDGLNLAAFDGKDGSMRWETNVRASSDDWTNGRLSIAGQTVLYADPKGKLTALSLLDGQPKWQAGLGERANGFCQRGQDVVVVTTTDEVQHAFQLGDGTKAPAGSADSPCQPLMTDHMDGDPDLVKDSLSWDDQKIPGMKLDYEYVQKGITPRLYLGYREKGTRVPMVAVMDGDQVLWKSDVPATRPLEVEHSRPRIRLTPDRVYALYKFKEFKELPRLTAFDLRTGKRLWESELEEATGLYNVHASATHVFAITWHQLEAFDPKTGQSLYTVGASPSSN